MSIQNAKFFLKDIQESDSFRDDINSLKTINEFNELLEQRELPFSSSEIEEAFNMLHVQCQSESEAESLKNAYLYYQLIIATF